MAGTENLSGKYWPNDSPCRGLLWGPFCIFFVHVGSLFVPNTTIATSLISGLRQDLVLEHQDQHQDDSSSGTFQFKLYKYATIKTNHWKRENIRMYKRFSIPGKWENIKMSMKTVKLFSLSEARHFFTLPSNIQNTIVHPLHIILGVRPTVVKDIWDLCLSSLLWLPWSEDVWGIFFPLTNRQTGF